MATAQGSHAAAETPPYPEAALRAASDLSPQAGRGKLAETNTEVIPVIDLGPYLAGAPGAVDRTAEELRFALTEIGFYFIINHGVPSEQIQAVFRQAARFHALPLQNKLEVKLDKHNVGYLPMRGDTLRTSTVASVTKANINEAFFVARDLPGDHPDVLADRRFRSANRWPTGLPGFREPIVAYCETLEQLVRKLVRLYARALHLPLEYFDQPFNEPQYKLRMTHYPYQPDLADDEFGIAPHTDTSFLTLLAPNDIPGLSIRTQSGKWIEAPAIPGAFVVNGGQCKVHFAVVFAAQQLLGFGLRQPAVRSSPSALATCDQARGLR